ncbi:MAG: 16S rRNA (cytidine(1402)-2'-O)-methyltransferase [Alphaproteobacteria bacterium HGW-Alphaproteobacteria-2]|nr:MAG: 16S rRNA (cytidine(1402)-2'-O)-methyltransferase [Alphaproteobacteria bacterium HGW-Alphaproteobacteria-2]
MQTEPPPRLAPGLYFVATPIGNARDITLRALDVLAAADVLAAEDTRRTRQLLDMHGIGLRGRRFLAYHEHNAATQRPVLLTALREGQSVACVSDAGTPLVSDPGFALLRAAIEQDSAVHAIPGPSAVLAALSVAGLPTDRFLFAGFPPAAAGARQRWIDEIAQARATLVIFDSAKRVRRLLGELGESLGMERQAALCRELTKHFEEVRRGTLAELAATCDRDPPRGEIVLLVDRGTLHAATEADIRAALRAARATGSLRAAVDAVSADLGVPRRQVYQLALDEETNR